MHNFADQCLDMARSILGHNLESITEDGTITAVPTETSRWDEPGHAALAMGEFYRATGETSLNGHDLIDLTARCITAQTFTDEDAENGLAYAALGLLSFGPAKDRNIIWERLLEPTQQELDKRLLARTDYNNHYQAFNIAKSVTRYSMGLSKKDETGKLIDKFTERIDQNSSASFFDDCPDGLGGKFDIYGIHAFIFIRQALQLHANIHLRERKLPTLRTYAEKYIRLLPDIVRSDGLGWCYGQGIGAYGQMHCISIVLQALRDGWIAQDKIPVYCDILKRLFLYFFVTYLDQEHGYLVIRDEERNTTPNHTTRLANFDAARYLCQWARLTKTIGISMDQPAIESKTMGRYVPFIKTAKKEQGLFIYHDHQSGLHAQIPLLSGGQARGSDYLAFPHCPGVFDWPVNMYLPVYIPELTFEDKVCIPSYYGKRCTSGLGLKKSFFFRYEQPELITVDQEMTHNLGSCKVSWTFMGGKITSEFLFTVKNQVELTKMRYMMPIASPHSTYRIGTTFCLGEESLRANVLQDDFQASWKDPEIVSDSPEYASYWGKIHYLQTLSREHSLVMRPGAQYRLVVEFEPDLVFADE